MRQYKSISLLVIMPALFVQSCKVSRDYVRPELNLPSSYDNNMNEGGDEIPDYSAFYKNQGLVTLLDTIMKNNPDMQMAAENILAAEATLKNVKLNYLPDVSLEINAGIQQLSKNSMTNTYSSSLSFENYTFSPALSWELGFWGKFKYQREQALAEYLNQNEIRRAVRVELISQVAQGYYNLLNLDEQLRITRQVEQAMDSTLTILKTQFEVGETNSLAIRQSESQLAQTRALVPEIKASIKAQENTLRALAGTYPDTIYRTGYFDDLAIDQDIIVGKPAALLANRPDVKQSELALRSAHATMAINKASLYPAFNITAAAGLNSITVAQWPMLPASLFGNALAGLSQPVFYRKKLRAAYEASQHKKEAAVYNFRKTVVNAVAEVTTSLTNITADSQKSTEIIKNKTAMIKAMDDAQFLYLNGEATYLEVLVIQQEYLQAELAYAAVRAKQINDYITLFKAIGGN